MYAYIPANESNNKNVEGQNILNVKLKMLFYCLLLLINYYYYSNNQRDHYESPTHCKVLPSMTDDITFET